MMVDQNQVPVVLAMWAIYPHEGYLGSPGPSPNSESPSPSPPMPQSPPPWGWSLVLFSFLALSRFGVWVFDLTTQQLAQTLVPAHRRSAFAGVEAAVVNVFELAGAGAAVAFPRTAQFPGLALASLAAVVASWAMYAAVSSGLQNNVDNSDRSDSRDSVFFSFLVCPELKLVDFSVIRYVYVLLLHLPRPGVHSCPSLFLSPKNKYTKEFADSRCCSGCVGSAATSSTGRSWGSPAGLPAWVARRP